MTVIAIAIPFPVPFPSRRSHPRDGGYSASALGHGIHTQGDSLEEIHSNVKEAVDCYFDDTMPRPKLTGCAPATSDDRPRSSRAVRPAQPPVAPFWK